MVGLAWLQKPTPRLIYRDASNTIDLAPLPPTAHDLRAERSESLLFPTFHIRFKASPNDIARYLKTSPGLRGIKQLRIPKDTPAVVDSPAPAWFDVSQVKHGRLLAVEPNRKSYSAYIAVNDDSNTVFISATYYSDFH